MPSVTWQLSAPMRLSTGLIARGTTDERRSLVSLSSISLAGAGRPYQGRPVLRPGDITDVFTIQVVKDQMRSRAKWAGRRSNPRLRFFRPPPTNASVGARVSATDQVVSIWTRKNPMPFCDTGLMIPEGLWPSVTGARDARAWYSPVGRRTRHRICVQS